MNVWRALQIVAASAVRLHRHGHPSPSLRLGSFSFSCPGTPAYVALSCVWLFAPGEQVQVPACVWGLLWGIVSRSLFVLTWALQSGVPRVPFRLYCRFGLLYSHALLAHSHRRLPTAVLRACNQLPRPVFRLRSWLSVLLRTPAPSLVSTRRVSSFRQ